MFLFTSISVVVAALALFLAAAVSSVIRSRRNYEKALAISQGSERRPRENGSKRSALTRGLEISVTAELTDWRFPDRQRFGPFQGLPQSSRPSSRTNISQAPEDASLSR
jgi:hypothetical protein